MTDYDRDPEALAWARAKVQAEIERAEKFVAQATEANTPDAVQRWQFLAAHLRNTFIGGDSCVVAVFDERLPAFHEAIACAVARSSCGAESCADCR